MIFSKASNLYPRLIDLDWSVDSDNCNNSSNLPRSLNMFPRLEWASAKSGFSSIALRVDNSASSNLPISLNITPRLEYASGSQA